MSKNAKMLLLSLCVVGGTISASDSYGIDKMAKECSGFSLDQLRIKAKLLVPMCTDGQESEVYVADVAWQGIAGAWNKWAPAVAQNGLNSLLNSVSSSRANNDLTRYAVAASIKALQAAVVESGACYCSKSSDINQAYLLSVLLRNGLEVVGADAVIKGIHVATDCDAKRADGLIREFIGRNSKSILCVD